VLRQQLEPHMPHSVKRYCDTYPSKLESNPEEAKTLIEKLGSQPTVSLNEVMEYVSQVDTMLHSKQQLTQVTFTLMEGKVRQGGGGASNDRSCYAGGEVGNPVCTCPNKEMVLAARKEKQVATNTGTEMKDKDREKRWQGSHGRFMKGGHGGGGGGTQQSRRLAQTTGSEIDIAKVAKVQELSDNASDDVDSDNSGSDIDNQSN